LAAFCFMVGTLTRSAKLVYGFVTALYVVYIPTKIALRSYAPRFGKLFDLFPFDSVNAPGRNRPAELVNQLVLTYDAELIVNRCIMLAVAAICLTITYRRFTAIDMVKPAKQQTSALGLLGLIEKSDRLYHEDRPAGSYPIESRFEQRLESVVKQQQIPLPQVTLSHTGWRAWLSKLFAAIAVEFRLLGGERSLVIMIPLAVLMCIAQIPPFRTDLGASPFLISANYAAHSADALLLLLFGVAIFFTGESVSRDRELNLEATLWCAPAPDAVFLLSKFTAVFCLSLCFIALGALTTLATQSYRNFASLKLFPYFIIYSVILLPTVAFMTGASLLLSVWLREKYIAYIVGVALGGGLFTLLSQGYTGWLYNPTLHQLWSYAELSESGKWFSRILLHRIYWLAITLACLALAHRFFSRKATSRSVVDGRLSEKGWAMSIAIVAALLAILTGWLVAFGDWR
jgi:ABC-type transport system involved in multi-copper enzyme maturation permease subunit